MSNWILTTYKTRNWSDDNQALKQRGSLSIWFDAGMDWEASHPMKVTTVGLDLAKNIFQVHGITDNAKLPSIEHHGVRNC